MIADLNPDLVQGLTELVLPKGLAVVARDPRRIPVGIDPQEGVAVKDAVPRRVAEFHAGRAAARAAMVSLGMPPRPIPMGPDRAPIWPNGLVGSISHSKDACVAAVGLAEEWAGVGVDLEEAIALDPLLIGEVCTKSEQRWLGLQPPSERGLMAKLIFSAKEAAYKAQYPISGVVFGFDVLEIIIDREATRFEAVLQSPQGGIPAGAVMLGSFAHAAGLLVTGVAFRQSELDSMINS